MDAVEALMKKHDNFEKSLEAQEEKFKVEIITQIINIAFTSLLLGY